MLLAKEVTDLKSVFFLLLAFMLSMTGCVNSKTASISREDASTSTRESGTEQIELIPRDSAVTANHESVDPDEIPVELIERAINTLHIVYWHTSHGSQITDGLSGLAGFDARFSGLDIRENPSGKANDLGNPDNKAWALQTRKYLDQNKDVNVVMWSWCGQLSSADAPYVQNYLDLMCSLENEYPEVTLVYMTGHLAGTGESGSLAVNNVRIRAFCEENRKVLYDFADIESYNPDGVYFGDRYANDACGYDSDEDKIPDRNWAIEWQQSHVEGVDWFSCGAAHSQPVNANMKAYAMWNLMARIAAFRTPAGS